MKKVSYLLTFAAMLAFFTFTIFLPGNNLLAQDEPADSTVIPGNAVTYQVISTDPESGAMVLAQVEPPGESVFKKIWDWFQKNGAAIIAIIVSLFSVIEVVVRLTPTKNDDAAFAWLRAIFDSIFPNLKAGGGTHPTPKA